MATIKGILIPLVLAATASNAFASTAREDNSGFFVWVFLGFCALIIVAQLVPAVLMMFGIAKGIAGRPVAKEAQVTSGKGS